MKKSLLFLLGLCLLSTTVFLTSCDNDDDDTPTVKNIVEFAQDDPDFSLLVDAVIKAELTNVLSGTGPFTLFAPKNDAFQAFLNAAGTNTIENTPKEILVDVLTNHVLAADVKSTDLQTGYFNTLSSTTFGSTIYTDIYVNLDNGVTINGTVDVVTPDVEVSNGTIHVIDEVIALPTVVTFALADPNFSTLVQALTTPGLSVDFVGTLTGDGPFTVFAPTNSAFQALLDSNPDWNALTDIPTSVLEKVLLYHVTNAGNVRSTDLSNGQTVPTLASGESFQIDLSGANPQIIATSNTANIIFTDVQASNGVVHVIDTVIVPD